MTHLWHNTIFAASLSLSTVSYLQGTTSIAGLFEPAEVVRKSHKSTVKVSVAFRYYFIYDYYIYDSMCACSMTTSCSIK